MADWIGKTIGRVRIEKMLARGGMAEVYLGSHLTLERPVAIKLLHSYVEEEPLLLGRFHREAKVVAGLRHPNIVQIFDFDTADGHPYIVMEYLGGPTLAAYLRHLHQRKKRLTFEKVAGLLKGLTDALDYAHGQGVIHRDIKPGNIMLHNKKEEIPLDKPLADDVEAILTDFGLVRVVNTASQTASGFLSGTPAYMSPEQARGDQIDQRTDIYSLGVVLYEMLAGRVPFEADNTVTVLHMHIHTVPPPIPGIPAKVQAVLDRALAKKPDDRYRTSQEMANDFYRSIGMPSQVAMKREPYPLTPVPFEIPPPTQLEPEVTAQLPAEPPPKLPPQREPEPPLKSQPRWTPEPPLKLQPQKEPESRPKSEPRIEQAPKPARSRLWIPVVLVSVIGLAVLGIAAYFIFIPRNAPPQATATASPEILNTTPSPPPSAAPALPSPDRMVPVSAGTYWVGDEKADGFHSTPKAIPLEAFWIDQFETTNEEYQKYLQETAAPDPTVPLGENKHPVRGVSFEQAKAYCQWMNKRLPKEAEWEAAGRGTGENPRLFPWEDPALNLKVPNEIYEVGSLSFNVSPLDVYDLVGNVWEWVDEPYEASPPGINILRGGRYSLPYDLAFRYPVASDDDSIQYAGFRCAADEVR